MADTDYLFQQSEVIAKELPDWFGKFDFTRNLIKSRSDLEVIGERDFRVNFMTQEGGRFGTFDPDGGALGRGSAAKGGTMIASFYPLRLNFELTELAKKATASKKVSQVNALKRVLKKAIPEMAQYCDKIFHGAGTAFIATATAHTTSGGVSIYTMDESVGVMHLRRGQYVIPYNPGGTAQLDSGTARRIVQIDYDVRKIYLDATVSGASSTDKFAFEGVSGSTPTSVNGMYVFSNYAKSGTTLGVNRANELEIVANSVNAGGIPTFMKGTQLKHKMLKRRGEIPSDLVGIVAPEQQANIRAQVQEIANYDLAKGSLAKDLDYGVDMSFRYAGMKCRLDIHQKTDRMDFMIPKDWIRATLPDGDIQFFEDDNGDRFFQLFGGDGSPATTTWLGLVLYENFVCHNPGQAGVIYGCTQPEY
jgi:hypothetical protein